jgi:hypothetical protein
MDQTGWAWCGNCQGLYFTGSSDQGVCPAGGQHDGSGSAHYVLDVGADPAAHPHGQPAWAWCHKCQGLGYGPQFASSLCPAGGQHDATGSGNYTLDFEAADTPADQQRGWRSCNRCQGLFFAGGGAAGVCPAGNGHNSDGSSSYVMRSQAAVLMSARLSPVVFSQTTLLATALFIAPQFTPDQEQAITADSNVVIKATDGSSWCQLGSWVGWPGNAAAATWQCRSSQLTILVPSTRSGVQVLPFTEGFPAASMTLENGDKLPLTPVLEPAQLRLVASFGADPPGRAAYDNAIGALSGHSGVGATVTIATSHDISVTVTVTTPGPIVVTSPPRFTPVPVTRVPILPGTTLGSLRLAQHPLVMTPQATLAAPIHETPLGALRLSSSVSPVRLHGDIPATAAAPATAAVAPSIGQLVAVQRAPVLIDRTDWGRIFLPRGGTTTTTTVHQTTMAQTEIAQLTWHAQSEADCFPDVPRAGVTGDWRQITRQATPGGSTTNLFYRPGGRPEVFFYLPTAYKLGFHAGDDGSDPPGLPFRVTMARAADGLVTISVTMTAMPYLADDDRAYLHNYVMQNGLQPYVELEAASGMAATFQGDFLSAGQPVANSSIRYQLTAATSDLLEIQFTMDELDYGLLVPMLQRGITGEVVLSAENQAFPVPVALRLNEVITNAIAVDVAPNGVAGSAPFVGSLTLTNRLAYPVQMESLGVDLVYAGAQSDIVFGAEELSVHTVTPQTPLEIAPSATSSPLNYVPSLPVWTRTAVVPGVVSVDGPAPADWIATVNRDPSLQPSKISVTLSPAVPAAHAADIRSITVSVFEAGAATARQPPLDIAPGHDAPIELDLSLAELASGANLRTGYFLEFTSRFADDTRSLPQRIAFDLTRRSIDLLALWEPAGASYFVDSDTTIGPLTREAASQVIDLLRQTNKTWAVRAVAPQPTGG